jgi:Icc protein
VQPRVAEYPRPGHFLLHFSDTHLISGDGNLYGGVSSDRYLKQIFTEVIESGARPEAMIFTGDIADTGEMEAYRKIRIMAESVAEENGAQIIWAMGNHDNRPNFYSGLLGEEPSNKPLDRIYDINGLRVITLDTSVPGHHYGEISQDQLDWLAGILETPAKDGSILALHHPPIPAVIDSAITVELRDQKNLEKVIAGSDIRSIIAGHLHYSCSATFAGIPVSVASSTCYTQDLNVKVGGTFGRDIGQSFNMIHVYNGTVLHSVVPAGRGELVGRFMSAQETADIMKAEGITIPEA